MARFFTKINLWALVSYLVVLALLISLGFWQLGRADQKREFIENQQKMQSAEALQLDHNLPEALEALKFRRVKISGDYDSNQQILLDNQHVNGKVGYFVFTPLKIKGSDKAVLINRGWLPLNVDRKQLPAVMLQNASVTLSGRVNSFPEPGIKLAGADQPTDGWPSVVGVLDSQILSKKMGYALYSYQIELDPEQPEGYLRNWHGLNIMPPEKHIAYAVQWFGLAIALTLLVVWLQLKQTNT